MQFPARFSDLPEYAFPRLRRLLEGIAPGGPELAMTIGEPKHPLPDLVAATVAAHAHEFALYPPNDGTPELRHAIAGWLARRYGVAVDPDTQLMPLNGTREGLFNAAIALSPETKAGARPAILMPNPFYQAYGAAALAVGAEPVPVPATAATGFLPDYAALPPALLDRVTLCYLCSPANPQGAVADAGYWRGLIALAERHDFRILADECYAEIYRDTPPPGALEVGRRRRRRPRAGGDLQLALQALERPRPALRLRRRRPALDRRPAPAPRLRRRAAAPAAPARLDRALAGRGPRHAPAARSTSRSSPSPTACSATCPATARPEGGFFLWLEVGDGEAFALRLWRETGVRVLPGGYLGRATAGRREPRPAIHPRRAGGRRRRGRARPRRDPRHPRTARAAAMRRSGVENETSESSYPVPADTRHQPGSR